MPRRDTRGYTLAEVVIVMMIFSVVMALISLSFSSIAKNSSVIVRGVETDIGGLIGLELLRSDVESAGFGLPWSLPEHVTYQETSLGAMVSQFPGTAASTYNDTPPHLPRAYNAGDGVGYNGSDYLVLKGSAVGMNRTSRSWGYLNYSSTGTIVRQSKSGRELKAGSGDRAIVLKSSVHSGVATRELVTAAPGSTAFTLVYDGSLQTGFLPQSRLDSYLVYGVAPQAEDEENNHIPLSFPYNRADYYLAPPDDRVENCAPLTATLYKSTIDHSGGHTKYPILDCVADMQVEFGMQTQSDGRLFYESDISGYEAGKLRELLKEVRLWVMAQQGSRDPGYRFPMPGEGEVIAVGGEQKHSWSRSEFLHNGWEKYRWKVYRIVVQPKNL